MKRFCTFISLGTIFLAVACSNNSGSGSELKRLENNTGKVLDNANGAIDSTVTQADKSWETRSERKRKAEVAATNDDSVRTHY